MNIEAFTRCFPNTEVSPEVGAAIRREAQDKATAQRGADAVVELLTTNSWAARTFPGKRGELPPNTIKITVGFKPSPYWDAKRTQEWNDLLEKSKKADKPKNE